MSERRIDFLKTRKVLPKGSLVGMQEALDIILQCKVSADLAAQSGGFEPYRYECANCGEEVYVAAAYSTNMSTHFRHRNGNNDVECKNYMGGLAALNIDSRLRKSNRERVEFYFELSNKTFNLGLRFSSEEINVYEQHDTVFELRLSASEQAFFTLSINNMNFSPDVPTWIPINKFSFNYFLTNTLKGTKHKYDFFKPDNTPIFFKMQGNGTDSRAKLVQGTVLYTNVPYIIVYHSQYPVEQDIHISDGIYEVESFRFETMGRRFLGKVLTIINKTAQINALVSSWGYQLESSETLTLLWPPATLVNDVTVIDSGNAFLYSSFNLQAHGNINVHSEDIFMVTNGVSKVSVKQKTKVFKKNAEIILDKEKQLPNGFDEILSTESSAAIYIVPDDSSYFLFNRSGVKRLSKGQSVPLTPRSEIRSYYFGYLSDRIYPLQQRELTGELLLNDIVSHYKRTEAFDKSDFSSYTLSKNASQYIDKCEASGLINTVAKKFIEEGRL